MKSRYVTLGVCALVAVSSPRISAFCGFYVGKADTKLFNKASQVVLVRDGDRTVITMANDYRGELREFAMVVPVPTFIERGQIHVAEKTLIEHLDAYTAPRLVEYFDSDPCVERRMMELASRARAPQAAVMQADAIGRANALGVRIEASYTVGEYDILILSAKQSGGLEQWLRENGYRIPAGASQVVASYLRQNMKFFVAKVNLGEQAKTGSTYLRPLQIAYESPKFMLPIRLGTVNADGAQELFIYTLTPRGRVEATNYRTVRLPSGDEIPTYVKEGGTFGAFYKSLFTEQVRRQDMSAVFVEYAWDMSWCDPCAADPLSRDELRSLGVFWLDGPAIEGRPTNSGTPTFVTRLHVRYDAAHFPEDLVFQETADKSNFQGRYVLRHPWTGTATCEAATVYRRDLIRRQEREAQTLASLTGWNIDEIRRRMLVKLPAGPDDQARWWERLWKRQ